MTAKEKLDFFLNFTLDDYLVNKTKGTLPIEFDMNPQYEKTDNAAKTLPNGSSCVSSMFQYMAGNCFYNGKLSCRVPLFKEEEENTKNIDALSNVVKLITPKKETFHLFHGFEPGLKYGEANWDKGDIITFNFHLSKTPAIWVAQNFSDHWSWYMEKIHPDIFGHILMEGIVGCYNIGYWNAFKTKFIQKFLFCIYPSNTNYGFLSSDHRSPEVLMKKHPEMENLILKEEFEYLSGKDESFRLIDIVDKYSWYPPFIRRFYIMEFIGGQGAVAYKLKLTYFGGIEITERNFNIIVKFRDIAQHQKLAENHYDNIYSRIYMHFYNKLVGKGKLLYRIEKIEEIDISSLIEGNYVDISTIPDYVLENNVGDTDD